LFDISKGRVTKVVDLDAFRLAMTRLPSAVTIITTGTGARRRGLTATGVCSLSVNPASIVVCVNSAAEAHDFIVEEKYFAVNVLEADQVDLAEIFAGKDGLRGVARFAHGNWRTGSAGSPILVGAAAAFDCRVAIRFNGYSHGIFVGEVDEVHVGEPHRQSLLWYKRLFYLGPLRTTSKSAQFKATGHNDSEGIYGW
jgi:flavin reductase